MYHIPLSRWFMVFLGFWHLNDKYIGPLKQYCMDGWLFVKFSAYISKHCIDLNQTDVKRDTLVNRLLFLGSPTIFLTSHLNSLSLNFHVCKNKELRNIWNPVIFWPFDFTFIVENQFTCRYLITLQKKWSSDL